MEITPISPSEDRSAPRRFEKYVVYDMTFEPGTPVPVLRCAVPDWPVQANEAEIKLWCKFAQTSGDDVPLARLSDYPLSDSAEVNDVRFDWNIDRSGPDTRIVVHEWHPKGKDIYRLKLELLKPDKAKLKQVYHRFLSRPGDEGLVRHEFCLLGTHSDNEINDLVVRIVSLEHLQKGAVTLPRSLKVTIPRL